MSYLFHSSPLQLRSHFLSFSMPPRRCSPLQSSSAPSDLIRRRSSSWEGVVDCYIWKQQMTSADSPPPPPRPSLIRDAAQLSFAALPLPLDNRAVAFPSQWGAGCGGGGGANEGVFQGVNCCILANPRPASSIVFSRDLFRHSTTTVGC